MLLKDKVAIITGSGHGIGQAFAIGYSKEGAKVVVADIDKRSALETADQINKNGGLALGVKTDVSSLEDTLNMAKTANDRFGRIDILINNAAVIGKVPISRSVNFWDLDLNHWDKVMAINVKGVLLCSRAVFPYMKEQGSGKIINMASISFYRSGGRVKWAHYVASKGAVIGLTHAFARELGEYKINVNCISPGGTVTEDPGDSSAIESRMKAIETRCLKRAEVPEDLVGTAIFLGSSASDYITGQNIIVDGGDIML